MEIKVTNYQARFLSSKAKETAFVAGIRSGKTFAGAVRSMQMLSEYPDCPGLICANTWSQLTDSTLAELTKLLDKFGRRYEVHEQKKLLLIEGRRVFLRSLENYDAIRGLEVGWAWIDEASYSDYAAYLVVLGRLSHPAGPRLAFITMTPRGRNWVWGHFYAAKSDDRLVIDGVSSHDNPWLEPDYLAMIEGAFTGEYLRQEVYGEFVSMRGRVYQLPDSSIVPYTFRPHLPYDVSIDFGRRRPAVLFFQEQSPGVDVMFDAILPEDVLIQDLCSRIAARYPFPPALITCDPAGDAANTQTYQTDVAVLRKQFPQSLVRYATHPAVRSIEAGVGHVKNRIDKGLLLVADSLRRVRPGEYTSPVAALTEYAYAEVNEGKQIGNKPIKDGRSDHPCDALRYYIINKRPAFKSSVSLVQ